MDCSWPIGHSLNDGIHKDKYLGKTFQLKYPTVDKLARKLFHMRASEPNTPILLYKEDMDRAFRQLSADPFSVPLLGYRWRNQYYFDLVMVMGCRIAPYICQRTTEMVAYLHQQMGYFLMNYVDDFIGAEYIKVAKSAHEALKRLMDSIGAQRSLKKSVTPTEVVEFLGNLIDTINMTIGVTPQRKTDMLRELESWKHRGQCTRRQLESLIGKLQFMSNCIRLGRLFVSRLLNYMKTMDRNKNYKITEEIRKDIKWWYTFLPQFEGTSILWLLDVEEIDRELAVDACMVAAGGVCENEYYRTRFPDRICNEGIAITHLEMWAVIIAVNLWGSKMTGKIIRIRSDNEAVA